ncbi:MAG: hypothetical protein M1820_005892 [Bogoriella megaspora]|nr:MAG: hypothetical protein M1820_005892 [Bogoriella megaspora]
MSQLSLLFSALLLPSAFALPAALAAAPKCALTFDARFPASATGSTVDSGALQFNNAYDLGQGQTWANVLKFPTTPASLFDNSSTKAVEVTINDQSIFQGTQTGFRRSELLPNAPSSSTTGIQTLHLSLQRDDTRPLNYSHEYMLAWLESSDYSRDQFCIGTGTIFGNGNNVTTAAGAQTLFVRGNNLNAATQIDVFNTPFTSGVWHNLALTLNFNTNTIQVYYSQGNATLTSKSSAVSNDLTGNGQYHVGILKKPTGTGLSDITKQGFQESNINEGIIFGGAYLEDSSSWCVSTGT